MSEVIYIDIPGFPGYRVGDDGTVWTCLKRLYGGPARLGPYVPSNRWNRLVPLRDERNRLGVNLCRDNKVVRRFIHRLVLLAFRGPCPKGMECCHFPDRDPTNNRLENLRWDTRLANAADRVIHGTTCSGDRNGMAKLTETDVLEIRRLATEGKPRKSLASAFGVGRTMIDLIVNRQAWKHL